MSRWMVLLVCAALWARPAPALACSCASPGIEVTPGATAAAPLNAQVRIAWWAGAVEVDEASIVLSPAPGKKAKNKDGAPKDKKARKADDAPPAAVEVETRSMTAGQVRLIVLAPRQLLLPDTRYQVLLAGKPGGKAAVVGAFTTAKVADDKPPTWSGAGKTSYVHAPAVCCNCSTGNPWAVIELADAAAIADDLTAAEHLVYGVWPASGVFDAKAPPLAVVRAWGGKVYLGHKSSCSPRNFDFPAKGKTLSLRIAPIDQAGNVGAPAEIKVELTKPVTKAP